jgi:hypothetical protein
MATGASVIVELINRELKRRGCNASEFAEICHLPEARLQQILDNHLAPTQPEIDLLAPRIARDKEGQAFWTANELTGLLT